MAGSPARPPAPSPASPRRRPAGLEQRLLARTRAAGFTRGDRLIVGFSGGRDSLALAAALRRVEAVLGVEQHLVHVDHRLRPESGDDAQRAAELAAALGLAMQTVSVPAPPRETHPGVGLEEAARRERYRLLYEAAWEMGARAIVTAHHLDDQAETVLLHLLRGGGVHGAAGMAELSLAPIPTSDPPSPSQSPITHPPSPWLWRPLLSEPRAEIEAYVAQLGLTPIEDPSNEDRALRRNALRHEILPLLEEQVPGAKAALARYAMLAAEENQVLDGLVVTALWSATTPNGGLIAARLRDHPLALRRRIVRRWLQEQTASASFTAERTDAIIALARERAGGRVEIGEGWKVSREGKLLRLTRPPR